jgi:pyruvate kinase
MLIDDGRIELQVVEKSPSVVVTEVMRGGHIQPGKGLNLPGVHLSTESMTDKDWEDLRWGIEAGVDFVALSFVRHAEDLARVHQQLDQTGSAAQLIAKIERPEAIENIEQILALADGLMVARGDLGLETDLARVPMLQKHLIGRCRSLGKPVITATQMLESMVHVAVPTRAEVSDVANAIYDGSDAIMLSGETATGKYPIEAVRVLHQVATVTERDLARLHCVQDMTGRTDERVEAIVEGAAVTAKNLHARGVVIYTQSGATARKMARYRLPVPLVAVTNVRATYRQLNLSFGVHPVYAPDIVLLPQLLASIDTLVLKENLAAVGDTLVVVSALDGRDGNTDTLHIHQVRGEGWLLG